MTRLAVIADDLTGALDASAPFAMRGFVTVVALSPATLSKALSGGADVIGVSTDSREIAPEAARAAVAGVVAQLPSGMAIFKKVDSRLKGNIGAELDAIPHGRALVVPAIPAFGRVVQNGQLTGFGIAQSIDIAARLGVHADRASIPEATSQDDIDAAVQSSTHDLLVGARGLAEAVAHSWSGQLQPAPPLDKTAPVILAIGSTDPITLAQVSALRDALPEMDFVDAPNGIAATEARALAHFALLQATPGHEQASPAVVARNLAASVERLSPPRGSLMVLSGGATAQAILEALGIGHVTLLGEALPGLPIARAGGFTIITKSGGFGDRDTLVRLLDSGSGHERE